MTQEKPRFQAAVAQKPFKCEDCKQPIEAGQDFYWDSERKAGPRQYSWRICPGCQAKVTTPGASKSVFKDLDGTDTRQIKSTDLAGLLDALRNVQRSQQVIEEKIDMIGKLLAKTLDIKLQGNQELPDDEEPF
jgi:hypothetical protein